MTRGIERCAVKIDEKGVRECLLEAPSVSPAENVGPENERCRQQNEDQNGSKESEAGRIHDDERVKDG